MRTLAVTGAPGWLTQALFDSWTTSPPHDFSRIVGFVHPDFLKDPKELRSRLPMLDFILPFDLGDSSAKPEYLAAALEGVDVLLHSAAVIHVRHTRDWYRLNTDGAIRLAQAARTAGVRRLVFISSNAAGGRCESGNQILSESDPARPLSHYGRSKWLAEQALMEMHKPATFEIVILRPSMFYGPPVPERHVEIYRRILSGRLPIVGGGNYRRSITYIDNLVQAVQLAMSHPAASGETFYVVDEPVYTTRSIALAMADALGVPLHTFPLPARAGSAAYWIDRLLASAGVYWQNLHLLGEANWHVALSCQKMKTLLGYAPSVELTDGMHRAVSWCRNNGKL